MKHYEVASIVHEFEINGIVFGLEKKRNVVCINIGDPDVRPNIKYVISTSSKFLASYKPRKMIQTIGFDHGSIGIFINRRNPIGFRVVIRHPDP